MTPRINTADTPHAGKETTITHEHASRLRRRLRFLSRSLASLGESFREHLQEIERHAKCLRGILEEDDDEFVEVCQGVDVPSWSATLSVRARTVLKHLGVVDSESLSRLNEDSLLGARNCGKNTFSEIVESLAELGVVLPDVPKKKANA